MQNKRDIILDFVENILDRIQQIVDNENTTTTALERKIGASKGVLSGAMLRGTDIQSKWVQKIVENYPLYNSEWLLTGSGEMMKLEVNILHNPPYRDRRSDDNITLYDIDAAANLKTIFDNKTQNIIGNISIPDMPICDGAIRIRGDSMYPILKSGDIVVYKEVPHHDNIIYGEMYLVDFTLNGDYYLVVKYVRRSELADYVKLISYNTNHDPMNVPMSGIRALAIIKASVRFNTMI